MELWGSDDWKLTRSSYRYSNTCPSMISIHRTLTSVADNSSIVMWQKLNYLEYRCVRFRVMTLWRLWAVNIADYIVFGFHTKLNLFTLEISEKNINKIAIKYYDKTTCLRDRVVSFYISGKWIFPCNHCFCPRLLQQVIFCLVGEEICKKNKIKVTLKTKAIKGIFWNFFESPK
jgi:hypothetical protein